VSVGLRAPLVPMSDALKIPTSGASWEAPAIGHIGLGVVAHARSAKSMSAQAGGLRRRHEHNEKRRKPGLQGLPGDNTAALGRSPVVVHLSALGKRAYVWPAGEETLPSAVREILWMPPMPQPQLCKQERWEKRALFRA
jgi:hypothetical protein